jgi:hypothetical protein
MPLRIRRTVEAKDRMFSGLPAAHVYDPTSFDPGDIEKALIVVKRKDRSDPFVVGRARCHMAQGITCPQDYLS